MKRLIAAAAVTLALAGCADAHSTSGSSEPRVQSGLGLPGFLYTGADVEKAQAFLRTRPPIRGWNRGVVLTAGLAGPQDHLRWTAVVVNGGGRLVVVESANGDSLALAALVGPGDYVRFRTFFGDVAAPGHDSKSMSVEQKAAVAVAQP